MEMTQVISGPIPSGDRILDLILSRDSGNVIGRWEIIISPFSWTAQSLVGLEFSIAASCSLIGPP